MGRTRRRRRRRRGFERIASDDDDDEYDPVPSCPRRGLQLSTKMKATRQCGAGLGLLQQVAVNARVVGSRGECRRAIAPETTTTTGRSPGHVVARRLRMGNGRRHDARDTVHDGNRCLGSPTRPPTVRSSSVRSLVFATRGLPSIAPVGVAQSTTRPGVPPLTPAHPASITVRARHTTARTAKARTEESENRRTRENTNARVRTRSYASRV